MSNIKTDPLEKLKVVFNNKEPYQYTKISDYKYCIYCGNQENKDHENDCLYKAVENFLQSNKDDRANETMWYT